MKKAIYRIFCLAVAITSFSHNADANIKRDSIYSDILEDNREVSLYLPPSYYSSNLQYPVLYILDGDYNFNYVSGLLELQASISENIPEMILVAISGKGSETYKKNCKPNIEGIKDKGNADQVSDFIQKELIPYITSNYRTSNYKILAGHSIGGLFVINTALNQPSLFNNYIAISPALWWENNAINQVASKTLKANSNYSTNVYVSLANEKGMGVGNFLKVATGSFFKNSIVILLNAIIPLSLAILLFVRKRSKILPLILIIFGLGFSSYLYFYYIPSDSNFKFEKFPNENHNSVGAATYTWALKDIFQTWKGDQEYFNTTAQLKTYNERVLKQYNEAFNLQSVLMGNTIYILQDKPAELEKIQKEVIKAYPNAVANFNLQWAQRYIKKGNIEEGQKLLQETIIDFPNYYKAYDAMAKIELQDDQIRNVDSLIYKSIRLAKSQKAQQWQLNELEETQDKINSIK